MKSFLLRFNLSLSMTLAVAVLGCSDSMNGSSIPEATAENCRPENVKKIRDKSAREAFASRCFRSGKFEPSPNRTW